MSTTNYHVATNNPQFNGLPRENAEADMITALRTLKRLRGILGVYGSVDGEETINECIRMLLVVSEVELNMNVVAYNGVPILEAFGIIGD